MKNVITSVITIAIFIFIVVFVFGALQTATGFFKVYDAVGTVMASEEDTLNEKVALLQKEVEVAYSREPFLSVIYKGGINEYYEILLGYSAKYNPETKRPVLKDTLFLDSGIKEKIVGAYSKDKLKGRTDLLLSMIVFDFDNTSLIMQDFREETEKLIDVTKGAVGDYKERTKE